MTCREDCTIDYGGSTTKYRQLSQCLQGCEKEQAECTTRHYSLRDTGYEAPDGKSEAPAARIETPRDGVRRGVYRASDSEPAAEPEPKSEPASDMIKEPDPDMEAAPEPAPKAEQQREPAPEVRSTPKQKSTVKKASAKSGDIRIFGDDEAEAEAEAEPEPEPAPRQAPKRVEPPPRPVPPAEPKKKDISDWDPNER